MEKIDKGNMYQAIWDFSDNIIDAIKLGERIKLNNKYKDINKIIIAGMGGSAIGGDVVYALLNEEIEVPFFIIRGYNIPSWVDNSTLVICSSYSGNTEETIAVLEQVKTKDAQVCSITTGGEIKTLCSKHNYDSVIIPSGLQPRAALAFSFIPLLYILLKLKIIKSDIKSWLIASSELIASHRKDFIKKDNNNPIWGLAKKIYNKIPIIYADSQRLETVAVRLKGQICENSKILAYHNIFPELNHNEIVGWENNKEFFSNYFVIWLYDKKINDRNKARQKIMIEMLDELGVEQQVIQVAGRSFKERFLLLIHYGDWLSYWCAILHKTDPSPVKNINMLKNKLLEI